MMRIVFLMFLCCFAQKIYAQTDQSFNCCEKSKSSIQLDSIGVKFLEQGYDEWISYSRSTQYIQDFDDCAGFIFHVSFLLKKKNTFLLKNLVFCNDELVYNVDSIVKDDRGIFSMIAKEKKDIVGEEILPGVYQSKNDTLTAYFPLTQVLHATYYILEYRSTSGPNWTKGILRNSVMKDVIPGYPNLNYRYNQQLNIFMLWKLMQLVTNTNIPTEE